MPSRSAAPPPAGMPGAGHLFLSHSGHDKALSQRVQRAAARAGYQSLFLDFDPDQGIPAGRHWERELYIQIERCDAVLALDSPHWRRSRWCTIEIALARMLHKPILPLTDHGATVRGGGTASLLGDTQAFSLTALLSGRDATLWRELQRLGVQAGERFTWDPDRTPYPGLVPLDAADAGVFFGRGEEVRRCLDALERFLRLPGRRLLLIVGPSGSGKSSLLRAGLVPLLARRPQWATLELGDRLPASQLLSQTPAGVRTVLIADQIDEHLAAPAAQRETWAKGLQRLMASRHQPLLAGTLRTDTLDRFQAQFPQWLPQQETLLVGAMTRDGWRAVIEEPARRANVPIERSLVDALLAEVAPRQVAGDEPIAADSLPLLATLLRRLWERRDPQRGLTLHGWQALGGLTGAVGDIAEALITALQLDEADIAALRRNLVAMLQIERDGRFTRRPLAAARFAGRLALLRDQFVGQGLLVEGRVKGQTELAHEALVRTWPRLARWADEASEQLRRRDRLEHALLRWRTNPAGVLDEVGLVEAEALVAGEHIVDADALRLVEASRRHHEAARQRDTERLRSLAVSESLRLATEGRELLAAEPDNALRLAWEALLWQRNEVAEALFREALYRLPAPMRVLASGEDGDAVGAAGDGSFGYAVTDRCTRVRSWDWTGRAIASFAVAARDDGCAVPVPSTPWLLVAAGGAARLLDAHGRSAAELALPGWQPGDRARPRAALSQPDAGRGLSGVVQQGRLLWTLRLQVGAASPTLHLHASWSAVAAELSDADDADARDPHLHRSHHRVTGLDINPAGSQVLTHGSDGVMHVFALDGRWCWSAPQGARSSQAQACFTADGSVFSGSLWGGGRVDRPDGSSMPFRDGMKADLFVRAFDAERQRFVTADNQGEAALELRSGDGVLLHRLLQDHEDQRCAALSSDGRWIAAGGRDRRIRIWDSQDGTLQLTLDGHATSVQSLAFGPRRELLSLSYDGEIRLWWLDRPVLPAMVLPQHRRSAATAELTLQAWAGLTCASVHGSDATTAWRGLTLAATLPGLPLRGGEDAPLWASLDRQQVLRLWHASDLQQPLATLDMAAAVDQPDRVCVAPDGAAVLSMPVESGVAPQLWRAEGAGLTRLVDPRPASRDGRHQYLVGAGFHPDGRLVTGHRSGRVNLWTRNGQWATSLQSDTGSPDALLSLAVHPRGNFIVTGGRMSFRLWTWEGKRIGECDVAGYKVQLLRFNGDATRLLSVSDSSDGDDVAEWWTAQGERLGRLHWPGVSASSRWWLGGEHDGLVAATDDTLYSMRHPGDAPLLLRASRGSRISAMTVDPAGRLVAVLFSDGQLRVWDRHEGRVMLRLRTPSGGPLLFSGDGQYLLVGQPDGRVEPHALAMDVLFEAAAQRLRAGFSAEQIERFNLRAPVHLNTHGAITTANAAD